MAFIASTRFNDDTWRQNQEYRFLKEIRGCIYCQRLKIKESVPLNSLLFVIEMNNSTNQIEGIGLIRNYIATDKTYRVYSDSDFNRYIYRGDYRISRDELCAENESMVLCVEQICFKGKTHLKRIPGISIISDKLLYSPAAKSHNLKKEIHQIFVRKFKPTASIHNININVDVDKKCTPNSEADAVDVITSCSELEQIA